MVMPQSAKATIFTLTCCSTFIISLFLFGYSFATIEPTHMGIAMDHNVMHLEWEETYMNGRYFVGVGRSFVLFPRTYQSIRFGSTLPNPDQGDVVCRSQDGMVLNMEVSFQYQLSEKPQDLARLYLDFGENYRETFMKVALQAIRDGAGGYKAFEFFTLRNRIAEDIHNNIRGALKELFANVPSVELVNMEFNEQLAKAIENTQMSHQDVEQAKYEKEVAEVEASQEIEVAITLAEVLLMQAGAQKISIQAEAEAEAATLTYRVNELAQGYLRLKNETGMADNDQLLAYLWTAAVQNSKAGSVIMGMDGLVES